MAVQLSGSSLRRSYQLLAKLHPSKMTMPEAFEKAATILYAWARRKYRTIFKIPFNVTSYENRKDGWSLGILYDGEKRSYIMKCTHPDSDIAGRYWITDVQLSEYDNSVYMAVRLSVSSLQSCTDSVPYSRPSFVERISKQIGVADCEPILKKERLMSTTDDLQWMYDALESEERSLPMVVVAPKNDQGQEKTTQYLVDVKVLASDLFGYAHVVKLSYSMVDKWKETAGAEWSVPYGAVRTYYPGVRFEESESAQHPWLSSYRITLRNSQVESGEEGALQDIEGYVKKYNTYNQPNWENKKIQFYSVAYTHTMKEREKQAGESLRKIISLQKKQIEALDTEKEENLQLATSYSKDLADAKEELELLHRQIASIKGLTQSFRHRIEELSAGHLDDTIPVNGEYEEIPEWINKYYPDKLAIVPRARRELKDACYEDVGLVYKCLKLLATDYYKYRMGEYASHDEFMEACKRIDSGLDECQAITDVAAGMQGDEYYVSYGGERRKLDRHLTKGSSKDRRYCLRIYYFWDEVNQMVVIGHLPSHLTTSAT